VDRGGGTSSVGTWRRVARRRARFRSSRDIRTQYATYMHLSPAAIRRRDSIRLLEMRVRLTASAEATAIEKPDATRKILSVETSQRRRMRDPLSPICCVIQLAGSTGLVPARRGRTDAAARLRTWTRSTDRAERGMLAGCLGRFSQLGGCGKDLSAHQAVRSRDACGMPIREDRNNSRWEPESALISECCFPVGSDSAGT
jgi:hypothetical protein